MLKKKIFWVIILGLILRLNVIDQSLWLDESIGAWAVSNFSYKGIINEFLLSDNHPPLYYLTLKLWTSVFGYSELSIRLPSVIYGLGTIFYTYKIGKIVFIKDSKTARKETKKTSVFRSLDLALVTAVLLATSPLHVYYSQEARMYSMAALFAATSIYYFIKTLELQSRKNWFLFSISILGLVFTDYMPVFMLPVFWLLAWKKKQNKSWLTNFLLSHLPLLLAGLMWLPIFSVQSEKGQWLLNTLPAWRDIAGGASLKQALLVPMKFSLGRISFDPKILYYLLVVLTLIPYGVAFAYTVKEKLDDKRLLILTWLFFPLLLGFTASFMFPAFIYFRYIYILPAFYMVAVIGINNINSVTFQKLLITLLVTFNVIGLCIYYFDSSQHREDWRGAAKFIDSQVKSGDVVLFEYPQPFTPYRWYSNSMDISFGATNSISADPQKTIKITEKLIEDKNRVFHFDYLKDLSNPADVVEKTLMEKGYIESEVYEFRGIGQVELWEK